MQDHSKLLDLNLILPLLLKNRFVSQVVASDETPSADASSQLGVLLSRSRRGSGR